MFCAAAGGEYFFHVPWRPSPLRHMKKSLRAAVGSEDSEKLAHRVSITLLVSHGVQGQRPCRSAMAREPGGSQDEHNPFSFHCVPPQAAHNEN